MGSSSTSVSPRTQVPPRPHGPRGSLSSLALALLLSLCLSLSLSFSLSLSLNIYIHWAYLNHHDTHHRYQLSQVNISVCVAFLFSRRLKVVAMAAILDRLIEGAASRLLGGLELRRQGKGDEHQVPS